VSILTTLGVNALREGRKKGATAARRKPGCSFATERVRRPPKGAGDQGE
jgi:hypothetical protein